MRCAVSTLPWSTLSIVIAKLRYCVYPIGKYRLSISGGSGAANAASGVADQLRGLGAMRRSRSVVDARSVRLLDARACRFGKFTIVVGAIQCHAGCHQQQQATRRECAYELAGLPPRWRHGASSPSPTSSVAAALCARSGERRRQLGLCLDEVLAPTGRRLLTLSCDLGFFFTSFICRPPAPCAADAGNRTDRPLRRKVSPSHVFHAPAPRRNSSAPCIASNASRPRSRNSCSKPNPAACAGPRASFTSALTIGRRTTPSR